MAMRSAVPNDIDEYIANAPAAVQPVLSRIRATVAAAAPEAQEVISYRMPAFKGKGILLPRSVRA